MSTCCDCGNQATYFYDDEGNDLPEPLCDECWFYWNYEFDLYLNESFGREWADSGEAGGRTLYGLKSGENPAYRPLNKGISIKGENLS